MSYMGFPICAGEKDIEGFYAHQRSLHPAVDHPFVGTLTAEMCLLLPEQRSNAWCLEGAQTQIVCLGGCSPPTQKLLTV